MIDYIYYCIYLTQVVRTKYYDIPKNYQDPIPHRKACGMFVVSSILWVYTLIDFSGLILLVKDKNDRVMIFVYATILVIVLSCLYLLRKGKSESIVYNCYEKRGGINKPDALFGIVYYVFSFFVVTVYELIKYILNASL